jgi:hypothetical protein
VTSDGQAQTQHGCGWGLLQRFDENAESRVRGASQPIEAPPEPVPGRKIASAESHDEVVMARNAVRFDGFGRRRDELDELVDQARCRVDESNVRPAFDAFGRPGTPDDRAIADDDAGSFETPHARKARAWRKADAPGKRRILEARITRQFCEDLAILVVEAHGRT